LSSNAPQRNDPAYRRSSAGGTTRSFLSSTNKSTPAATTHRDQKALPVRGPEI
jgi:hypothetical protein